MPPAPPAVERTADAFVTHGAPHPVDLHATLARLGRGPADPTHRRDSSGAIWRTGRSPDGRTGTIRLRQVRRDAVSCEAWGDASVDLLSSLSDLLGDADDHSAFVPHLAVVAEAHRVHQGLRTPRSTCVFDSLIGAVIEQRVVTLDAHAAWRRLHLRFAEPAPGPCPPGMRAPLSPAQWLDIPSWEWHRAGVDARRAATARQCAAVAGRVEEAATLPLAAAMRRLMAISGVGAWTAAEVAQRALGDADAVSVGDYHLASAVGWTLVGRPVDDATMLELLEPWRPFRYRLIRLLDLSGAWRRPKFGPRAPRDRSYTF